MRRLKQSEGSERAELEQDLTHLKSLDTHSLSLRALSSKLVKSKLLPKASQSGMEASMERFPLLPFAREARIDAISLESLEVSHDKTHERVAHQVLSSKVLAAELAACIRSLIPLIMPASDIPASLDTAHSNDPTPKSDSKAHAHAPEETSKHETKAKETPRSVSATLSSRPRSTKTRSETGAAAAADEYESDDGMGNTDMTWDRANLDAMVASGSDTESDSDSDSQDHARKKRPRDSDDDGDDDIETDHQDAFLPSLNTGFIPAADGDDWSDAEADYADTGGKGPAKSQRKNRRGQRERRAIWEKKYGRHANHLKLREKEPRKATKRTPRDSVREVESRRDTRTTHHDLVSTPSHARAKREERTRTKDESQPGMQAARAASSAHSHHVPPAVHPSWEAKQRAKEAQQTAKPQGTKIVFD